MTLPPGVQAHGGGWRGRYSDADGARHWTAVQPSPRLAELALGEARASVASGGHIPAARGRMTLSGFAAGWWAGRPVRANTNYGDRLRFERVIAPHLGGRPLAAITPLAVQTWLAGLDRAGVSRSERRKAFVLLRTMLGRRGAVGDRRLAVNPCAGLPAPKSDRPAWTILTAEQFEALIAAAERTDRRALLLVAGLTGLRWSELAGLRRCDWNPLRREITVRQGVTYTPGAGHVVNPPKDSQSRTVPLHPRAGDALAAHVQAAAMPPEGLLWPNRDGGPMHHSNFRRDIWLPALAAAGLTGVRFHDLRHSCASRLLEGGLDLAQVKAIMGHASVTTTELYLHVDRDRLHDAVLRAFG